MRVGYGRGTAAAVLGLSLAGAFLAGAGPRPVVAQGPQQVVPGQYIVVLKQGVADSELAAVDLTGRHGLGLGRAFQHGLKGFVTAGHPADVAALARDPRVAYVEPDQWVSVNAPGGGGGGKGGKSNSTSPQPAQLIPTGVSRVGALASPTAAIDGIDSRVDATVAVIDTGIQLDHPDLNVVFNKSFVSGYRKGADGHGHGTHVAGTIAALDNGIGVVGVAPGAKLWALKVLADDGTGTTSNIIAALDYVAAYAGSVDVANLSLGGYYSQAVNDAVARVLATGVTVVVAAGNSGQDVAGFSPASAPGAVTVSALADSDGAPGGRGSNTGLGADDTMSWFTNYGAGVDVTAPGVNIYSTWIGSGYYTISGTSMAAPHVAGVAALHAARQRQLSTFRCSSQEVCDAIVANGEYPAYSYWANDQDSIGEPVARADNL